MKQEITQKINAAIDEIDEMVKIMVQSKIKVAMVTDEMLRLLNGLRDDLVLTLWEARKKPEGVRK